MKARFPITALIVAAAIIVSVIACTSHVSEKGESRYTEGTGLEYSVLRIRGMTCIWIVESEGRSNGVAGLTCNWSEWKGK
jgi:hypothetical protein